MADGDHRFLVTAMAFDPIVAGLQRRLPRAGRGKAGFNQGAPQIPIAVAQPASATFAGTLVLTLGQIAAQRHRCAAVGKRPMSAPVSTRIVVALRRATPGIVTRRASSASKGRSCSSISAVRAFDRLLEEIHLRQNLRDEKCMMGAGNGPCSASRKAGSFRRSRPRANSASALRSPLPPAAAPPPSPGPRRPSRRSSRSPT